MESEAGGLENPVLFRTPNIIGFLPPVGILEAYRTGKLLGLRLICIARQLSAFL
jgi:hypothetical protein